MTLSSPLTPLCTPAERPRDSLPNVLLPQSPEELEAILMSGSPHPACCG